MTTPTSRIARVLDELVAEREHTSARLQKLDAAIATMHELFHLPRPPVVQARTVRAPRANGHGTVTAAAIRAALHDGPMRPGDLAKRLGVGRVVLRHALKPLEADGTVISSGVTAARRVALPGRPAKGVP